MSKISSAPTPLVELTDVTLNYGGDDIVRDANLIVRPGESKIILGPSGVGKSTILKTILGILKPIRGRVMVHGRNITQLSERDMVSIRLQMAMVFQNGALFDSMTVGENVSYRLREFNMGTKEEIEDKVQEMLKFVGLLGAKKLRPAQLSGGMRKRVAIARALASNPDIFLFDEPTVGLDPINHYNIENIMLKLKEIKKAMLIVTHDVQSAFRLADSMTMIHEGRFIFDGTPAELRASTDSRIKEFLDPGSVYPHH